MRHGFTLIELLVVVTIIVVLLALLVPALDKAIYQAELAACGAKQKGIVNGGLTYAAANKRVYIPVTNQNPGCHGLNAFFNPCEPLECEHGLGKTPNPWHP